MLSVLGERRSICPVGEVTTTSRMLPLVSVTTWLTVPIVVPALLLTVRPVVRPGSVLAATCPLARTLRGLAWLMPLIEAWLGPWLTPTAGLVLVVVVVVVLLRALL